MSAHLSTPLAVSDDWSPSLDALLIKLILDEQGLATSNPTAVEVQKNQPVVDRLMPMGKGMLGGEWYWQTSSPLYLYDSDSTEKIHKRWDSQERNLGWKGKRRNWSVSETNTKSWTILIQERSAPRIDWYCMGDRAEIYRLLSECSGLAKKRRTQVSKWDVTAVEDDWHLWRDDQLMRPVPIDLCNQYPAECTIRDWAWRPPTHIPENMALCFMPINNAKKVKAVYGCA